MDKDGLPLNKGKVYVSKASLPAVKEEYLAQFQEDFSLFLNSRSHEMTRDGRVILIIHGRLSEDPIYELTWEPLAEAIVDMVSLVTSKCLTKLNFRVECSFITNKFVLFLYFSGIDS